MGSDDTHLTDPVHPMQDDESASITKMTPSNSSGRVDKSGPSNSSSRKHEEQVQNLKDKSEVVDVAMRSKDNLIGKTKALVEPEAFPSQEADITLDALMRSGHVDPTPLDRSSGGDGSGPLCSWSLTEEEQVQNLQTNFFHAFRSNHSYPRFTKLHPWFTEVVAKFRVDPCLNYSELKFMQTPSFTTREYTPLHLAILIGDLKMVQKILETCLALNEVHIDSKLASDGVEYSTLDLAIIGGESDIVDALIKKNVKVNIGKAGSLQLAVLHARAGQMEKTSKIIQSLIRTGIDIKDKDSCGYSAFYLAVLYKRTDIVNLFLHSWRDKIHLNDECRGGRPPIQIASEEGFKDIEAALMQCEDVKRYINEAFRDQQAYVDAANAILVGAALIASVTFASWLQPPLNYTTSYQGSSMHYVDVEHNIALGSFWVFNTLSFYFAIGTVVFGAHSVLPRRQLFITETVKKLSRNLLVTSILLAFSVLFVIVAFGIAGIIVLIPILRYRWYMIAPTILGGIVCIGSIGYLFKSLWENRPSKIKKQKRHVREEKDIYYIYDYINDGREFKKQKVVVLYGNSKGFWNYSHPPLRKGDIFE